MYVNYMTLTDAGSYYNGYGDWVVLHQPNYFVTDRPSECVWMVPGTVDPLED